MMTKLHYVQAFKDNYIWLLELDEKKTIIIDPGQDLPVLNYLKTNKLEPIAILLTHYHDDHIGGVKNIRAQYPNISIYGPDEISLSITHLHQRKEIIISPSYSFKILQLPGHTAGHVGFYFEPYLFCGDVIFSAGCGRVANHAYQDMLNSINKIKKLPDSTIICPAHEYTHSNLKFARSILPDDPQIDMAYHELKQVDITLPTTLKKEKNINLFMRCNEATLQKKFNKDNEIDLFIYFRTQKDNF